MEFTYISFVGLIAAFLTTISFLPQAIKAIKTKDTTGISLLMYISFNVGVVFWVIFGILIEQYVIAIANVVTLSFAFIILLIKIKNIRNGTDK
jgi:MtN3 and saliva related transmembrane protein